jgi:hypothetical protein
MGIQIPDYAILSHTWGDQEVSLQDMHFGSSVEEKDGYIKIKKCCSQALQDGFEYAWVDTCCIDKTSSAELTEAINSMFQWYQRATVCYAYLSDVPTNASKPQFAGSRWFTRGWTLQELIAPKHVFFYSSDWVLIGAKEDSHLCKRLAEVTCIDEQALKGKKSLNEFSVAQRMAWASRRVTTRIEDIAYSLVGIFGVNMPLLYGEGERAFIRLQEEIMKDSDDQSLFAWEPHSQYLDSPGRLSGLLAQSPEEFAQSATKVPHRRWDVSQPYSMTNKGLRIELPLAQNATMKGDNYIAILECQDLRDLGRPVGIAVEALSRGGDQFARKLAFPLQKVPLSLVATTKHKTIYIRKDVLKPVPRANLGKGFIIQNMPTGFTLIETVPDNEWNKELGILRFPPASTSRNWHAALLLEQSDSKSRFVVVLGYNHEPHGRCWCLDKRKTSGYSWCDIQKLPSNKSLTQVWEEIVIPNAEQRVLTRPDWKPWLLQENQKLQDFKMLQIELASLSTNPERAEMVAIEHELEKAKYPALRTPEFFGTKSDLAVSVKLEDRHIMDEWMLAVDITIEVVTNINEVPTDSLITM